jgi:DNA polymerase-3 subunit delta
LNYQEAIAEIRAGKIRPIYLLYGSETYMETAVIDALRQAICTPETEMFNYQVVEAGPGQVAQGIGLCQTMPFLAERRLVVLRELPLLSAKRKKGDSDAESETADAGDDDTEALIRYAANPVSFTTLVITAGESVDTRRRATKALLGAGPAIECKPMKEPEAAAWAQDQAGRLGSRMGLEAATLLVDKVGTDLRAIMSELEKLQMYVGAGKEIRSQDVETLVPGSGQSSIFDLVDALGDRAAANALRVLDKMLLYGEPPLRILFMITRQVRMILLTRTLENRRMHPKDAAARVGVPPFLFQKLQRQARRFSRQELVRAMERLLQADLALKSGHDPQVVLQTLIIELAG